MVEHYFRKVGTWVRFPLSAHLVFIFEPIFCYTIKMQTESNEQPKETFLIITRDQSVFDPSTPAGKFILDISSVVPELHVICIGYKSKSPQKLNENTWVYTARKIPLFDFMAVNYVVQAQLVWKKHFRPSVIISIGDEISMAKKLSSKYKRPLYVFYSYMKLLGKDEISIGALVRAKPQKIFIPNAYVGKAIEGHHHFRSSDTNIKILTEFIDIDKLENILDNDHIAKDIDSRNKIFTMIVFPHNANTKCFSIIREISRELLTFMPKFKFILVVKKGQYLQARILRRILRIPLELVKEDENSINLFRISRLMLYFDTPTTPYNPILYSFIAGCPVLSSGDEYSKIILFNSGLEEYSHLSRDSKAFGLTIKKLIEDQYLYTKYKMNCIDFAKTAFTNDKESYIALLRDGLSTNI